MFNMDVIKTKWLTLKQKQINQLAFECNIKPTEFQNRLKSSVELTYIP